MEPGGDGYKGQDESKQPQVVPWEIGGGFWECFFMERVVQPCTGCPGQGWNHIPRDLTDWGMWHFGTWKHLDLMTSEDFPNPNNSRIPHFHS